MPKSFSRAKQISSLIHRRVASFISKKMQDSRLGMLTVSEVIVSKDYSYAKIYIHILTEQKAEEILKILNDASSYIRTGIAREVSLRGMPKLVFCHDTSTLEGFYIEKLLKKALK